MPGAPDSPFQVGFSVDFSALTEGLQRDRTNKVCWGFRGEKNLEEVHFVFAKLPAKVGAEKTFTNATSNYHGFICLITVLSGCPSFIPHRDSG